MTAQRVPPFTRRTLLSGVGLAGVGLATAGGVLTGGRGLRPNYSDPHSINFFWYDEGKRAQLTVDIGRTFARRHPGTTINTQFSGAAEYGDKLATQVAGGRPPDIFQLGATDLAQYATRGAVRQLDELVPDPLNLSQVPASVLSSGRQRGRLYYLPTGLSTQPALLFSRTKLRALHIPPPAATWTLEVFDQFVAEVRQRSGRRLYGSSDFGGDWTCFEAFVRTRGGNLFTPSGDLGFDRGTLRDWYQWWDRLRRSEGCVPMTVSAEGGGFENTPLVKGKAVITPAASAKGIQGFVNLTTDELGVLQFPRAHAGAPTGVQTTAVEWWAISARASKARAELAARFCQFALTDPSAARGMAIDHGVPLFPRLLASTRRRVPAITRETFTEYARVEATHPQPRVPFPVGAGELLASVLGEQNQDIGFGRTSVDSGVDAFFAQSQRILRQ